MLSLFVLTILSNEILKGFLFNYHVMQMKTSEIYLIFNSEMRGKTKLVSIFLDILPIYLQVLLYVHLEAIKLFVSKTSLNIFELKCPEICLISLP